MKRDRIAELHFYEWRIMAWATSETRDRLDATGRGIYRELLDQCYAQGKFPADPDWVCRRCACTLEQYEKTWPLIVKHFPSCSDKSYRKNIFADMIRKEYFAYVIQQQKNRKAGIDKARKLKEMHDDGRTTLKNSLDGFQPNGNGNGNGNTTATATHIQEPQTPCAPNGADLNGHGKVSRKRKDKRTTEEIRAELGPERLVWWDNFWEVFPCHDGMNEGINAFETRVKDHELAVAVWKGAKSYRAKCEADPTIKVKFAQGWLNSERWLDENNLPAIVPRPQQKSFIDDVQRVIGERIAKGEKPW